MVAASSLVLTVFMMAGALSNLFGVGGGSLVVRLLGAGDEEEARKTASRTLVTGAFASLLFSSACLIFMNPLLRALGASDQTIGFARQYLTFVVVIGSFFFVSSQVMSFMLRNVGYSKEAAFGLSMGGILNILLDHFFGMTGVIWTQTIADIFNVIISYLIYRNCMKRFFPSEQ